MSGQDDFGGCLGMVFVGMLWIALVSAAVAALLTVGGLFGAGVAVRNYALALRQHVAFERPTP
jgi:hypothetical protein